MALIKIKEEFQKYVRSLADTAIPDTAEAEGTYILPILGDTLYNSLNTKYNANNLAPKEVELVQKCQAVIAPAAYFFELPTLQINLSNLGAISLEADGVRKAYKWEYRELREELERRVWANQELLIGYLTANKADFADWQSSPYNSETLNAFIRNGADLRGAIGLQQPHRAYNMLKGIIQMIAESYLQDAIGEEYYTALNERLRAGAETSDDKTILNNLRGALIRKSLEFAAREMNIRFSGNGFTIVHSLMDQPEEGRGNANETQLAKFITTNQQQADAQLNTVLSYLNKNASESRFAEYYGSSKYQSLNTETPKIDNANRKIFVAR